MSTPTFETKIRAACAAHSVVLAYLFGSQARGTADGQSDVDVAVLLAADVPSSSRHKLRLRLAAELARVLRVPLEQLEVVLLQEVPTLLQHNVIRQGILLFQRDRLTRYSFEVGVERRYEDEQPYLERETAISLQRILAHRL